jgi:hypothetical protein
MSAKLRRAIFFLLALPALARAAWRVARLAPRLPLEELVERLRTTRSFALAPLRRRPDWLLASLDRVVMLLPPRTYGRCLKRSLYLLDLWSRCGLHPWLHLGVRRAGQESHEAHAWVTVAESGPGPGALATSAEGYPEAFRF